MLLKRIKLTNSISLTKVCIWKCYNVWHSVTFNDICLDVGDIIGVLFRIEHKETFLSKKPKWSLHSISIETCRKLSNEQGTHWLMSVDTFLMISVTLSVSPRLSWDLSCRFELSNVTDLSDSLGVFQKRSKFEHTWILLWLNLKWYLKLNCSAMWERKREWKVSSIISTEQFVVGEMQSTSINYNERKLWF